MPELPDIELYVSALQERILNKTLIKLSLGSPFVLRTTAIRPTDLSHKPVTGVRRVGKQILLQFQDTAVVLHLMIAGRLQWRKPGANHRAKNVLAVFHFETGSLVFTEASKKKRASLHIVSGNGEDFDRGGIDVLTATLEAFRRQLKLRRHTLKRALTDGSLFSGIGNAYSDEIFFESRLSPVKWTTRLTDEEVVRLYVATQSVLRWWCNHLEEERKGGFPKKVTAFREEMKVHGKYKSPCVECGKPIQRIISGEREFNYCAQCQNEGRLLADRVMSRLLKKDWPKTLDEWTERRSTDLSKTPS